MRAPSLWKLPRSVTSLGVFTSPVTLMQIRDIMAQLPNLDNLWLGYPTVVDKGASSAIGSILKGSFGGRLILSEECVNNLGVQNMLLEGVANTLLEVPTRLHFTEVEIYGTHEDFPSTVRLVEACGKTLVKLAYSASPHGNSHPFSWFGLFWGVN